MGKFSLYSGSILCEIFPFHASQSFKNLSCLSNYERNVFCSAEAFILLNLWRLQIGEVLFAKTSPLCAMQGAFYTAQHIILFDSEYL